MLFQKPQEGGYSQKIRWVIMVGYYYEITTPELETVARSVVCWPSLDVATHCRGVKMFLYQIISSHNANDVQSFIEFNGHIQ